MQSLGRSVAGHLHRNCNPNLFIQHCIVQRQVLATKDSLSKLPGHVHNTVDDVMNFFRGSHVRKEKLQSIITIGNEVHDYHNLVSYHKVRWIILYNDLLIFQKLYVILKKNHRVRISDLLNEANCRKCMKN